MKFVRPEAPSRRRRTWLGRPIRKICGQPAGRSGCGNQPTQRWRLPYGNELFGPTVEPENVAGTLDNEIDQHTCVDDVIVNQIVVDALDVRVVHVRGPVEQHQDDGERCTGTYQQSRD